MSWRAEPVVEIRADAFDERDAGRVDFRRRFRERNARRTRRSGCRLSSRAARPLCRAAGGCRAGVSAPSSSRPPVPSTSPGRRVSARHCKAERSGDGQRRQAARMRERDAVCMLCLAHVEASHLRTRPRRGSGSGVETAGRFFMGEADVQKALEQLVRGARCARDSVRDRRAPWR